jgi:hypothetical protein
LLYSHGNTNATKGLTSTKAGAAALPRYQRLTRTSFVPADQTKAVINRLKKRLVQYEIKLLRQLLKEGQPLISLQAKFQEL